MYTGSPARLTNYQNGGFDPAKPDEDVQTLTRYDGAGNVTWQRDALGRWTSMEYDALGATASRTVGGQTTSYGYTGDGVLAKATTPTTTTNYLQDFAAPLAQVLNDGTATALYGHERLAAQTPSATTWYAYDGLGRLRQTLDGSGVALASANYDPWGTPQGSAVAPFGFTGELQDGAGQVYLRARWSTPGSGTFTAYRSRRDEAWDTIPSSYHPYAYALSNPVRYTDPTGKYFQDGEVGTERGSSARLPATVARSSGTPPGSRVARVCVNGSRSGR